MAESPPPQPLHHHPPTPNHHHHQETKSPRFLESAETRLIPHLHNPLAITRLIFTSGLSERCKTLMRPRDGIWLKVRKFPPQQQRFRKRSNFAAECLLLPSHIIRNHADQHQRPCVSTKTSKPASLLAWSHPHSLAQHASISTTSLALMDTDNVDKPADAPRLGKLAR